MTAPPPSVPASASTAAMARGLGTTLLARLGAVVEVVAQPLYVAWFGLASYGLYAVLWAGVTLTQRVVDLGMTSALQRIVPQAADTRAELVALRTAMLAAVGAATLVAACTAAFAPAIAAQINSAPADAARIVPAIRLFAWALPLWTALELATAALRAKQLFGPEIRLRIMWEQLIRLGLAALFWLAGWGLTGLFIAHLSSLAVTVLLSLRLLARHYPVRTMARTHAQPGEARSALLAGLALLPAGLTTRLFTDAPPLALNLLLPGASGASAAGLYVIVRKIGSLVHLVRVAFAYVLAPVASAALRADRDEIAALYGFAVRLALVTAMPLAGTLAGGALPLLGLFGREAAVAQGALVIMLAARGIEAAIATAQPLLQVAGRIGEQLHASVAGLVVAALLALWWVPMAPLTGMAAAASCGFLTSAVVPMIQLYASTGLTPGRAGLARTVPVALVCAVAGGAVARAGGAVLPGAAALAVMLAAALAAAWAALRLGLPLADRRSLGGLAVHLRLVRALPNRAR